MNRVKRVVVVAVAVACSASLAAAPQSQKKAPRGFTSLFNGKDLSGWRGRQPNYNPAEEAKLTPQALAEKQAQWNTARDAHWSVDAAKQGGGLGSALLRHAAERCDHDGLPAYLEATDPRNKRLYAAHGFEELGVIQAGVSPPVWPMLRKPR